jgi:anti-sigma regulatory factor (Ser/Thr protein kinase)
MQCVRGVGQAALRLRQVLGRRGEVRFALARSKDAAVRARTRTAAVLWRWHAPARVIADAQLAVSELVSNAVLYGREPIGVRLTLMRGAVHITVHDGNPQLPRVRNPAPGDLSGGRGLRLIAAISQQQGCARTCRGKNVWCSLRLATP